MRKMPLILTIDLYTSNSLVLDLSVLAAWLEDLSHNFLFQKIIIEGGEPSVLSSVYLDLLIKLCKTYTEDVTIVTALQKLSKELINNTVDLQVHLPLNNFFNDFKAVVSNIKALAPNKVLTAVSYIDDCQGLDSVEVINRLNTLPLKSWEIKVPVTTSVSIPETESIISEYISLCKSMKFAFINEYLVGHFRPINNYFNTVYLSILPQGVLVHKSYTQEGVKQQYYTDIVDLKKDLATESVSVMNYCKDCPFQVYCLAESINPYYEGPSCSGFKNLLQKNT